MLVHCFEVIFSSRKTFLTCIFLEVIVAAVTILGFMIKRYVDYIISLIHCLYTSRL